MKADVFKKFTLYGVTDLREETAQILEQVAEAYRGGVDIVQLRSKKLSDSALIRIGQRIKEIAIKYNKLFFVNDRVDLALLLKADGVHLGQDDLPVPFARRLTQQAGHHLWIGKSTHSLDQAVNAVRESPDYIGVGPVFETPTKPDYASVGLGLVTQVAGAVSIPFVAIGGINETNLGDVLNAGATRVAMVRALFSGDNIYGKCKAIKKQIEQTRAACV